MKVRFSKNVCLMTGSALVSVVLGGCMPAILGAGAITESALVEERGLGITISDTGIRTAIHGKVMKYSPQVFGALSFKVRDGKVLVMGSTETQEQQLEVIRLIWQVKGVREVINEIQVGQKESFGTYAHDSWITTQLKSQMLFNRFIRSRNYSIDTIGGVVYIMGIAQSQEELDAVTSLASRTSGVKRVVSYARIKNQQGDVTNAMQPGDSGGAPIVQAAPKAEVRVEKLSDDFTGEKPPQNAEKPLSQPPAAQKSSKPLSTKDDDDLFDDDDDPFYDDMPSGGVKAPRSLQPPQD